MVELIELNDGINSQLGSWARENCIDDAPWFNFPKIDIQSDTLHISAPLCHIVYISTPVHVILNQCLSVYLCTEFNLIGVQNLILVYIKYNNIHFCASQ